MLSQIVSLEYKTKAYLGIQNLGCHYKISGCHFDTQNRLKNTALVATITKVRSAKTATHLLHHSQCLAWLTVSGSQTILNATRIWVWWTSRDPSLKQHMKKIVIVWMIFGSKLLCSFSMSAIYSSLKYLCFRQTQRSSGTCKLTKTPG